MKEKLYCGLYDKIYVSIPETTYQSLGNEDTNPFSGISREQIYHKFDINFVEDMKEKTDENSLGKMDSLIIIDDGASSLKSNKRLIDAMSDLVCTYRHRRTTIVLMCQDLIQIPLSVREQFTNIIYFKPNNQKRTKLFHDEYLSDAMTYPEFLQLCQYIFKAKGDFLHISLNKNPKEYYRNFAELSFKSLLNNNDDAEES